MKTRRDESRLRTLKNINAMKMRSHRNNPDFMVNAFFETLKDIAFKRNKKSFIQDVVTERRKFIGESHE